MISFDFHNLRAFFRPELSCIPPCSPNFEGAILDSNLKTLAHRFQVCYALKHMRDIVISDHPLDLESAYVTLVLNHELQFNCMGNM